MKNRHTPKEDGTTVPKPELSPSIPLTPKELALRTVKNTKGRMNHFWSKQPGLREWWDWFEEPNTACPPWVVDSFKFTPLMVAAAFGKTDAIRGMAHVADLDARGKDGSTALHLAAVLGDRQVVDALLDVGANEFTKNVNQKTARKLAEDCEWWDVVDLFAEPQEKTKPTTPWQSTTHPHPKRPFPSKKKKSHPSTARASPWQLHADSESSESDDFGLTLVDAHLPPQLRGKGQHTTRTTPRKHSAFVANLDRELPSMRPTRPHAFEVAPPMEEDRKQLAHQVTVTYKKKRPLIGQPLTV